MVRSCCVIGCTARMNPGEVGFYKIPSEKEPNRRKEWMDSIRRVDFESHSKPWTPSPDDRVCNAHFITGKILFSGCQASYIFL